MEEKKDFEIDIRHIAKTLLKKLWLILPIALTCAVILVSYTAFLVPDTYTATTQMSVSNVVDDPNALLLGMSSSDYMAASGLVGAYSAVLVNENSLNMILNKTELHGKYSISQLKSMISASSVNDTPILEISVVCEDKQDAQRIANAASEVLSEYDLRGASAKSLYPAFVPKNPNSKGLVMKALIGFVLGALVTAICVVVLDFKRDTVRSDDWLREVYGEKIPILAVIPVVGGDKSGKRKKYGYYERYGYYTSNHQKKSD